MFRAFWRLITNIFRRQSRRVNEAADGVYTGSAAGISDAFDDAADALVKDFKQLEGAYAQVLSAVEEQRMRLEELNSQEETLIKKRQTALALADKEPEKLDEHRAAYVRFQAKIKDIEAEQEQLEDFISAQEGQLGELENQLKRMQRELKELPAEKAREIGAFISNKKIIEAFDRINGLKTSYERGPLDAIRKQNRELTARATVKKRMAGVDAEREDARYEDADVGADDAFEAALAQRRADRAETTGASAPVAEAAEGDDGRSAF